VDWSEYIESELKHLIYINRTCLLILDYCIHCQFEISRLNKASIEEGTKDSLSSSNDYSLRLSNCRNFPFRNDPSHSSIGILAIAASAFWIHLARVHVRFVEFEKCSTPITWPTQTEIHTTCIRVKAKEANTLAWPTSADHTPTPDFDPVSDPSSPARIYLFSTLRAMRLSLSLSRCVQRIQRQIFAGTRNPQKDTTSLQQEQSIQRISLLRLISQPRETHFHRLNEMRHRGDTTLASNSL